MKKSVQHYFKLLIQISLGTKFHLKETIWNFGQNLPKNKHIQSQPEKNGHHRWILHIQINLSTKFQLKRNFLIFWTKLPKKGTSQNWTSHWILHIGISLGTKFQIKLKISIFWTKFLSNLCISSQQRKKWNPPMHYANSNYSEYQILLDTNNFEF